MTDLAQLSDEQLAALRNHVATAEAPAPAEHDLSSVSDADLMKMRDHVASSQPPAPAAENPHDFMPFLKNTWEGVKSTADELSSKPLPTIAYDRLVKPAIDTYHASREQGSDPVNAGLDAAANATGAVTDLGKGFAMPHILPIEAYFRSRQNGNSAEDALKDARNVGALVFAPKAVSKVAGGATGMVGRALAKEAGVTPEAMARYRAAPEAVNDAAKYVKDPEALKNLVDSKVAPVTGAVDTAQQGVEAAQTGLQSAKDAVTATRQPPIALAGEIPEHLHQASDKLSQMSTESFNILDQEGHAFKTGDIAAAVDKQMKGLKIGGVEPTVGPDAAAYGALGQFKKMITDMGENAKATTGGTEVPAGTVKQLIQTLDATSKAAYGVNAGALGPEAATNLAQVRSALNGALRDASPAYAAQMDELAPKVQLVSDMSKMFGGSEQSALSALQAASDPATPRGFVVRQMLDKYDAAHGTDFGKRVAEYFDKPKTDAMTAQQGLEHAQTTLGEKRAAAEGVSKLGVNSTENTVKAIQGGRNFEARKQLEALSPETAQTVQDAGVAKMFAKNTANGSRKAVIGGSAGAALGAMLGHAAGAPSVGGFVGGAVGTAIGGLADRYGGLAVKAALDAGIKLDRLIGTKYIEPIMSAAKEGPRKVAIAHYIWATTDPEYQQLLRAGDKDEKQPRRIPAE